MTNQHRLRPAQWGSIELWADSTGSIGYSCILELRARIEALEAAQRPVSMPNKLPEPVAPTDEELLRLAAQAFDYAFVDGGVGGGESEFLAYARAVLARWGQP